MLYFANKVTLDSGMDLKIMQEVQSVIDDLNARIDSSRNNGSNSNSSKDDSGNSSSSNGIDKRTPSSFSPSSSSSSSSSVVLRSVETFFDLPDLNVIWGLVAGIRSASYGITKRQKNLGVFFPHVVSSTYRQKNRSGNTASLFCWQIRLLRPSSEPPVRPTALLPAGVRGRADRGRALPQGHAVLWKHLPEDQERNMAKICKVQ